VRTNYRVGVPKPGYYKEVFNTDDLKYGGSNLLLPEILESYPIPKHGKMHSLPMTLPPLAVVVLRYDGGFDWL
jgi:1,4-alpha-glucan branching enzyme